MRPALVIKPNPVIDDSIGMLQGLKPLTLNTLLFQSSDNALDHPVLLRAVGRDELSFQAVASDQCCEAPAGEDQAPKYMSATMFGEHQLTCATYPETKV